MKAAQMKERPGFTLMKQSDVQNIHYMQMPRWLFFDPRYADLSLEAKVAYTFLLNRFQLSRRKGWINELGEVFVIFPRQALAKELRICEQRVTGAFKALAERRLVWEKRCGRGDANQIYLARVEPINDPGYECAPFHSAEYEDCGSRTTDFEGLGMDGCPQEPQNLTVKNSENGGCKASEFAVPEPQNPLASKKDLNNKHTSYPEVSQFVSAAGAATPAAPGVMASDTSTPDADRRTDEQAEQELTGILESCELEYFPPETARVFENAIERLYYSENYRIGNAVLPQCRVRSKLRLLDNMILRDAEGKLAANVERRIKNSTAYTMATIFNCISESDSDLMVDPYLNSLRGPDPPGR